jgi:GNAT superfamily N-acetyltransferase
MTDYSSPRIVIRPALPRDSADVIEFTKFIWDGHDYVGEVFREWLADPQGQLLVAEYAGHCVGTAKVTWLAPGQWWLEGFRVDPKFQGLKIGSRLDAYANEWWDEHGEGVLRLMTSSKRIKVHHLSEGRGFVRLGEVLGYEAEPLAESMDAFVPVTLEEVDEAIRFCHSVAPNGLMDMGWRFVTPNADTLRAVVETELAFWWRARAGLLSAWDDDDERGTRLTVGLAACANEDQAKLLRDFRCLAAARGAAVVRWMNVVDETVVLSLETAGYKRIWEDAGYLYERLHR